MCQLLYTNNECGSEEFDTNTQFEDLRSTPAGSTIVGQGNFGILEWGAGLVEVEICVVGVR